MPATACDSSAEAADEIDDLSVRIDPGADVLLPVAKISDESHDDFP